MTGIRAVRDPIELDHFAPSSGFLGVIDKDSKDEYGARVVWLAEPVQRQIRAYLLRVEMATRSIFGSATFNAAFRFLSDEASIVHIDQQLLGRYGPDYPYASNSHRHYMRTRLRELGVDGGAVDAWMGHGGIGREPYARHSAISPAALRDMVKPALERIWEELGWEVLPGRER
jgi:site-specific recombinase XerD